MRSLILAGAAALALGTAGTAPVMADDNYTSLSAGAHAIALCTVGGLTAPTNQVACAANVVEDPPWWQWWKSNDDNYQDVVQGQHKGYTTAHGTIQLQIGGNVVLEGDRNHQTVTQDQSVDAWHAYGTQVQVGGNLVVDGKDNNQSLNQSQSIDAGFTGGVPQVQVGLNVVGDGNHNTQSITQSQSAGGFYVGGSEQVQGALNIVGGGNGNTQTINQTQD